MPVKWASYTDFINSDEQSRLEGFRANAGFRVSGQETWHRSKQRKLGIGWIAARSFQTAQDRLVKGLRVAGVRTLP